MAEAAWRASGDEAQLGNMPATIQLAEKSLTCLPQRQTFERGVAALALAMGYQQLGQAQAMNRLASGDLNSPLAMVLFHCCPPSNGFGRQQYTRLAKSVQCKTLAHLFALNTTPFCSKELARSPLPT